MTKYEMLLETQREIHTLEARLNELKLIEHPAQENLDEVRKIRKTAIEAENFAKHLRRQLGLRMAS